MYDVSRNSSTDACKLYLWIADGRYRDRDRDRDRDRRDVRENGRGRDRDAPRRAEANGSRDDDKAVVGRIARTFTSCPQM